LSTSAVPPAGTGRWGLGDALGGILAGYVLALPVAAALYAATGYDSDDAPLWLVGVLQIPFWGGLVGAVVLASRRKGTGDLGRDFGLRLRRDDWFGFPVGALTQFPVVPLLYAPILWLFGDQDVEGPARELTDRATGWGVLVLAAVVVIGAPVVEELFFRGLVLRSLEHRFSPRVALVLSAAAFALFHLQGIQTPALFLFGLVAGHLAQRTGALGAPILAHAGFNAVTVVILLAT